MDAKSRSSGADNTGLDHARQGQAEAAGSLDREGSSDHTAVPLGWVQSGLGRKSRLCDGEGNLGQRRRTRVLPPKGSERRFKRSLWLDVEHPLSHPVKPTKSRMLSLSPLRTLLPRVMTSNRARHELIQLPTIIKVRLLGTRRQSGTVPVPVPDLAGDGDAPPSPSPICPESGTLPRPRPRFAGDGDAPPSPIPIGGSAPCLALQWTSG